MLELLAQTTQPDQVRAFYTDAFTAVLTTVAAMVVLFGILIPIIASWWQRKSFAKERELLLQGVTQKMDADRKRMLQDVHEKMNVDQERMLRDVRRKMDSDMGKTCLWIAMNAIEQWPEYALMMSLTAATYYVAAGDTASAIGAVGNAKNGLQSVPIHPAFKGLTMKSHLNATLNKLKELVDSEGMGEDLDGRIAQIEKGLQEVKVREDNGGFYAEPLAAEDNP